ncbi:MAG TPA: cyclic nucleotide-binding domain-containing protein, partial [Exilispira sp.]|nr:cyclic nucleotide-binding domain-containing protein [Exilispira sp.]
IISGNVSVTGLNDSEIKDKVYTTFEYFGEASILSNETRKADVIALTDIEAYAIDKVSFLRLISDTPVEETMQKLAKIRNELSWKVIKSNDIFKDLSSSQITQLEQLCKISKFYKKDIIHAKGSLQKYIYLLISGKVQRDDGKILDKMGQFIGDICRLKQMKELEYGYSALSDIEAYQIEGEKMIQFLKNNPGIYMSIMFQNKEIC